MQLRTGLVEKREKLSEPCGDFRQNHEGKPEFGLNFPDELAVINYYLVYYGNIANVYHEP